MKHTDREVFVIGHRNPDTDSICAAIGYAYLKQQQGWNAVAARAGNVNPETAFVLQYFLWFGSSATGKRSLSADAGCLAGLLGYGSAGGYFAGCRQTLDR